MERATLDLGMSRERLQTLLLFLLDWNIADDGKPLSAEVVNGLGRVHAKLYRCRKDVRDDLKRRGIIC